MLVEMLFGDVDERLGDVRAGVVDENVEAWELGDFGADVSAIVHVANDGGGAAPLFGDALRDLVEIAARAAEKDHFRARTGERDGSFRADAASRAGDERDAAVEAEVGRPGFVLLRARRL